MELPEGYINVQMKDMSNSWKEVEILYPANPGSVYHMTKCNDALFLQFYVKNYKLKCTDLHQGIVWGQKTEECGMHPNLVNRLDYDSDYGTVLNRFIIQAAFGVPLTIYGKSGGQTRSFIHIENSMDCMVLAILNPPKSGDRVEILNQTIEQKN